MKEESSEKKVSSYRKITRFLRSQYFFWICIMCLLLGAISFVYYSFKVDVERQDELLFEIRETQKESEATRIKVEDLEKTICLLQKQVESLGATPVAIIENCGDIVSTHM